ncbi:ABC transporter ATP-binding protein [Niallia sp. NCCP-28]|uniref:ABC transporter ATP-binding protein n=1 Tax=Niallia sp. NCCP-28 TaxID=2934712 RepID=UPI0020890712|nr:ABC transporter ATP-binding protein [Niallia sp. NCCP-28]GKU85046.1 ABC transporter ATP-binding protein [Niallia sp. NCCP-28]
MSFLELDSISYSYEKKQQIIKETTWHLKEGEFHSFLGRSGCGKTTLLKLASGLLLPDYGEVVLQGEKVVKPIEGMGYVFQSPTLLEWKTVMENVLLPINLKRKAESKEVEYAKSLLKMMNMEKYANHYATELSGGQQSRVAIARSLMAKPRILFLDEPFAALDAITREELQDDLLTLCKHQKISVLFITHDIAEAVYLSDHIGVMKEGEIIYEQRISLSPEKSAEIRYSREFNEICLKLRHVLNGGER